MKIKTNAGEIEISQIDKTTKQLALQNSGDGEWEKGDEVVLVEREGFGWGWVPTKAIESLKSK